MLFLVPLPILVIAVIVKLVSDKYKLKMFSKISRFVIFLCVITFIYFYVKYLGFDIIEFVINFFTI